MSDRVSKQIKLTESEFEKVHSMALKSRFGSLKCFLDDVLTGYIEEQKIVQNPEFLLAAKSGKYRTVWLDDLVVSAVKVFSKFHDASENAVIFTATKRRLTLHLENHNA
jgi:hypothetical protein